VPDRRKVRPTHEDPIVRRSELENAYGAALEYMQELESRLVIHERVLKDVIDSLEQLETAVFGEDEEGDEAPLSETEGPGYEPGDDWSPEPEPEAEPTGAPSESDVRQALTEVRDEEDAELQERRKRNALRRSERAAEGIDEDGPRARVMTEENPAERALGGDYTAPGAGVQVAPPRGPEGEAGWHGNGPA
jgi:hypothetical protein